MTDADMGRFIKFDKDDFVGRDASLGQSERTLQLIYFEVEAGNSDVRGGEPILAGEQCVGVTTSGAYGHYVEKSLGFGYVPPSLAAAATELAVGLLGKRHRATILDGPAYDPASKRLRA